MTTRNEALLKTIEMDLPRFHRERMAKLQSEQMQLLAAEEEKASPDVRLVAELRQAIVQTERNKRDMSITEREVLHPLRRSIVEEQARSAEGTAL